MDSLRSSFLSNTSHLLPSYSQAKLSARNSKIRIHSSMRPDPWSLSDGDPTTPKPRIKNPKNPLSYDNARRIIKKKAQNMSVLRRNQYSCVMTPKWIKRTPEQMVQYLEDDKNGHLYGKHVVAAIKAVRGMAKKREGQCDVRVVMSGFVGKLSFREMCVVLKEQKEWRQVRDFFAWMKLQLCYRPSVIVYTIVLRMYGQVGKIMLAEQTFLEMLEVGCEPDEVACGTMLCTYARWGHLKAMLSFYAATQARRIPLTISVYNFMLSSLQKKSLHGKVIDLWRQMIDKGVASNTFTYSVVISSLVKRGHHEEAFKTFDEMKKLGFLPEEVTYSMLISLSAKYGNWKEVLRLYEDMGSRGIVPSNYTCASLLTFCYKKEDYSRALSLFSEMKKNKIRVDEVIYGLLIRIYGKLGLFEDAQYAFEEIQHLGLLTDEKTYLAMAQVHLNSGNIEKALDIIEEMKSRNIWFSRYAYIVLLRCYIMRGDVDSAEVTFQALSKAGLPDASSCNDMLSLYMKLDRKEKAKDFITQMRKGGVVFDEVLLKTVIKVHSNDGLLKDAEQLIGEIGTDGSHKDNKFIQTLYWVMNGRYFRHEEADGKLMTSKKLDTMALGLTLGLYSACKEFSKIEEILKVLLETAVSISVVIQLAHKFLKGNISKAEALNDQIIKLVFRLDEEAVASLISLYGKQKMLKEAQEVFNAAADSPTCGKLIFNSMIDAYVKCGKPEETFSPYKMATEKGHDLGAVTIRKVVNSLTSCGKHHEAEGIICQSLQDGLELDTVTYNTFITAMLEAGKFHFAAKIFEHMLVVGKRPSIQTCKTMISVNGQDRRMDKAVETFNMARSLDLTVDEKT
ncbi:hypothetical protein SLA2020_041420 [Shorea laevis]